MILTRVDEFHHSTDWRVELEFLNAFSGFLDGLMKSLSNRFGALIGQLRSKGATFFVDEQSPSSIEKSQNAITSAGLPGFDLFEGP